MAKYRRKLISFAPLMLMLGIIGVVLTLHLIPVLAQSSINSLSSPNNPNSLTNLNSQQITAQQLYEEGERLRWRGTREFLQQSLEKFQQALSLFR